MTHPHGEPHEPGQHTRDLRAALAAARATDENRLGLIVLLVLTPFLFALLFAIAWSAWILIGGHE